MKEKNKANEQTHFRWFYLERRFDGKRITPTYTVVSKQSNTAIGEIKWHGAWRQFCIFFKAETVYNTDCLKDILDFIKQLNYDWKNNSKKDGE